MRTSVGTSVLATLLIGAAGLAPPASASIQEVAADRPRTVFPATLQLPDGFQPEGIATGPGPFAYFGSLADGSIFRINLVTGEGSSINDGPGTPSVGMKTDPRGRLFVAGGGAGDARVIDVRTGQKLASYQLAEGPSFINDVVLYAGAAWFTDSVNPVLYKLPLGPGGRLPGPDAVQRVPLGGELVYQDGFNVNGIATTPDGSALLVVQSNTGEIYRVAPETGFATRVDLGGEAVPAGDGMLRHGRTLFVVQNRLNLVAQLRLAPSGGSAEVVRRISDPRFDVPTTIAAFGPRLYLPNARFGTTPTPETEYRAVAIPRP